MNTKHIYTHHHFLSYTLEKNVTDMKCIRSEDSSADIMINNCFKNIHVKHTNRIIEGKPWELLETRRKNVKNIGVTDGVTYYDLNEYSSHSLTNHVDQTNGIKCVLATIYRNGKKIWTTY